MAYVKLLKHKHETVKPLSNVKSKKNKKALKNIQKKTKKTDCNILHVMVSKSITYN